MATKNIVLEGKYKGIKISCKTSDFDAIFFEEIWRFAGRLCIFVVLYHL